MSTDNTNEAGETLELAAERTGAAMTFHFEAFRASPSAVNYLRLHRWVMAHQSLLRGIPQHRRDSLLADLSRTPITEWPESIAVAASIASI